MSAHSDPVTDAPPVFDVDAVRARFSSLGGRLTFFDAPGGTQVPDEVGDAMARTLRESSGNLGAPYETSERVGEILATAKERGARFMGCAPEEIAFGQNMTSLNFALSRTAGREISAGDEIVVTRLDHDANVAPWIELARDFGLELRLVDVLADLTLDYDDLARALSPRTAIVAFPWASNMVGTRVDVARVCAMAHEVGALAWIDAVHAAAHEQLDVRAVGADVALCSPYKFCGPHLGMAYIREELADRWRPYKVRPHPDGPGARRFETGTMPFEALAGAIAGFDYLESIGGWDEIGAYERTLARRFLDGLPDGVTLYGPASLEDRVPTFLLNVDAVPARQVSDELAERGIALWAHDTFYAVGLAERLPYEHEAIRVGLIHYNTAAEVDALLAELAAFAARG